jgi:hypothetical protein
LGANENEYRLDCTSQAAPGYTLSRQVPPTSPARSSTTKSCSPRRFSAIAMPRPAKPDPMMAIRTSRTSPLPVVTAAGRGSSVLVTDRLLQGSGLVSPGC